MESKNFACKTTNVIYGSISEKYEIFEKIGEGAYGEVYRGFDKERRRIVAMKRLKMSSGNRLPKVCLREMETLQKAQHKNVIACRDFIQDEKSLYLTMDYAPYDLRTLINRTLSYNMKFEPEEVKFYTVQLLRGLSHIHSQSIIHRDLKPSNLLITHKGILKICDFGMARNFSSTEKLYSPLVVTRWYRAPEILLSYGKYGQPIDLWSVGCILAELSLMRVLFPGTSDIRQIYSIFEALGTPSEAVWPGYSELPIVRKTNMVQFPSSKVKAVFAPLTDSGYDLVTRMLTYDPNRRITAKQALQHTFFGEENVLEKPSTESDHREKKKMPVKRKSEDAESHPDEMVPKKVSNNCCH
ncbi:hypothetical protein WA026_021403 [Henosepilachna vigintioctopunctata]|uniref:Protein kinase domain-containing protein n=1 Tax=Henosepilachna vigintioctopunctata TaxID=420089 RepID=A0AAW1TZ60_9CUCU